MFMNIAASMLLLSIFWIKLLINLAKFPTVMINIQAHVPVVLDMDESNFRQWRTFFDLTFKKFGLTNHIDGTLDAILMQDGVKWLQIYSCIASWLYTTVSKDIMDAVYRP
jgi:hypothetical protein